MADRAAQAKMQGRSIVKSLGNFGNQNKTFIARGEDEVYFEDEEDLAMRRAAKPKKTSILKSLGNLGNKAKAKARALVPTRLYHVDTFKEDDENLGEVEMTEFTPGRSRNDGRGGVLREMTEISLSEDEMTERSEDNVGLFHDDRTL